MEWAANVHESMQLTPTQIEQIAAHRESLVNTKRILYEYIERIHQNKHSLEVEGMKLEASLEDIRLYLTPQQSAQVVLFCENNKFKREMHLWSESNLRKL